jgi:hypothetical protein
MARANGKAVPHAGASRTTTLRSPAWVGWHPASSAARQPRCPRPRRSGTPTAERWPLASLTESWAETLLASDNAWMRERTEAMRLRGRFRGTRRPLVPQAMRDQLRSKPLRHRNTRMRRQLRKAGIRVQSNAGSQSPRPLFKTLGLVRYPPRVRPRCPKPNSTTQQPGDRLIPLRSSRRLAA